MAKKNQNNSQFWGKGKSASSFEMREANKAWDKQQAAAQSISNNPRLSAATLEKHFKNLPQNKLVPDFLRLTGEILPWRQRELINIVARSIRPGPTWLALLKEHNTEPCRQLAQQCLRLWTSEQVTEALLRGIKLALQRHDENLIVWLETLTLEIAKIRTEVSLRPVERFLFTKSKEQRRWWRTNRSLGEQIGAFHKKLAERMVPADTPLVATAPKTDHELPLPASAGKAKADHLPVPSEGIIRPEPGFWQRILSRFHR